MKDVTNVAVEEEKVTEIENIAEKVEQKEGVGAVEPDNGAGEGEKPDPAAAAAAEQTAEPESKEAKLVNSVDNVLNKIKGDSSMSEPDKVNTLCILFKKIIEENSLLKTELGMMGEQLLKGNQAKEAVKQLNEAYKKQIVLVREENELKLQEEGYKRSECVQSYQTTMQELSALLETHTGQNARLRDENVGMAESLKTLVEEGEKREKQIGNRLTEYELQIKLLEHQVTKANIEKAEVKADMTKERLEIAQELNMERERSCNLEETVRLLKEQSSIYQTQLEDLATGAGNSSNSFNHFKTQIEKLNKSMAGLDRDTHEWREKYEISSQQVKKMNAQSLDREKEVGQLKKKLESMVKLNRTLTEQRNSLDAKLTKKET